MKKAAECSFINVISRSHYRNTAYHYRYALLKCAVMRKISYSNEVLLAKLANNMKC